MRLCILCVHIDTSSLWAEFVNNNRCIIVRSVFEEGGSMENLLLLSTVCEKIYLEGKWLKKNYQSSNLLNFHAHHLNLWFFCANSSFLLRLIVKTQNQLCKKFEGKSSVYFLNKGIEFLPQNKIFWFQYLCNILMQTFDISNLVYFIYKY